MNWSGSLIHSLILSGTYLNHILAVDFCFLSPLIFWSVSVILCIWINSVTLLSSRLILLPIKCLTRSACSPQPQHHPPTPLTHPPSSQSIITLITVQYGSCSWFSSRLVVYWQCILSTGCHVGYNLL